MSVLMKHLYASSGLSTIGSPLTLKEVLIKIGQPDILLNSFNKLYNF